MSDKAPESLRETIVITGVGRAGQVGEAIAEALGTAGYSLALVDRDAVEVDARATALRAQGVVATAHVVDLTDAHATAALARDITARNTVRGVVCVAGGFASTGPLSPDTDSAADLDAWHRQFRINVDTAFTTTRALLPALRQSRGAIVYFASAAALDGGAQRGLAAYVAAKSALLGFMRVIALDERAMGVRVNAVAPTQVRTQANVGSMGADAAYVDRESVAAVVRYLLSDDARNVSGQVLRLS